MALLLKLIIVLSRNVHEKMKLVLGVIGCTYYVLFFLSIMNYYQ